MLSFFNPLPADHSLTHTSGIKPDNSPVKGIKRGKGKKEKKKAADSLEKKKPRLDELKVLAPTLQLKAILIQLVGHTLPDKMTWRKVTISNSHHFKLFFFLLKY